MTNKNLESKMCKAVIGIRKDVSDINSVLRDLSMQLSYLIKDRRGYYDMLEGDDIYS